MTNCACCFTDYIAKCNDTLQVYAQLAPLSTFTWVISDKFDKKYEGEFTTDADGFWSIPVDELPPGLLTEYSGQFTLQVMGAGCKPVTFKLAQEYSCIDFTVKGGTYEKNTLGCDFSCSPAVGRETTLFQFEDEDSYTIGWTNDLLTLYGNSPNVVVYHQTAPNTYEVVDVPIQTVFSDGVLNDVIINNGGVSTGFVLIS